VRKRGAKSGRKQNRGKKNSSWEEGHSQEGGYRGGKKSSDTCREVGDKKEQKKSDIRVDKRISKRDTHKKKYKKGGVVELGNLQVALPTKNRFRGGVAAVMGRSPVAPEFWGKDPGGRWGKKKSQQKVGVVLGASGDPARQKKGCEIKRKNSESRGGGVVGGKSTRETKNGGNRGDQQKKIANGVKTRPGNKAR